MKTNCRWLIVPAILLGVGLFLGAQDPVPERAAGKVLLLKNGNAVEGDIVKIGTQMCVRRGMSEIWIDGDKTARLCADWNDAYLFLQSRLKLDSAEERLRFARWCQTNQLKEQALEQGKLAVQRDPGYREARTFVALLERTLKEAAPRPAAAATPATASAPAPHIDVNADTFASFVARVQPILTNKCLACHAGGNFRLDRVAGGSQAAAMHNNLDMVLAYLDVEKPAESPLLVKAVEAHGDAATAPLKDRKELPAQILLAWIEQTIATNPRVKEHYAAKKPAKNVEAVKAAAPATPNSDGPVVVSRSVPRIEIAVEPTAPPSVIGEQVPAVKQPQAQLDYLQTMARKQLMPEPVHKIAGSLYQQIERGSVEPSAPKVVSRPTQPIDPFDPVLFNQANYPNGPSWQGRASVSANR